MTDPYAKTEAKIFSDCEKNSRMEALEQLKSQLMEDAQNHKNMEMARRVTEMIKENDRIQELEEAVIDLRQNLKSVIEIAEYADEVEPLDYDLMEDLDRAKQALKKHEGVVDITEEEANEKRT